MTLPLGGPEHPNYRYFTQLCEKIFLCLRRHAAVFYTLLKDANVSVSQAEVQRHFDLRCGYRSAHFSAGARGRYSYASALASVPEAAAGGQRTHSGAGSSGPPTASVGGVGARSGNKGGARYGESARILDDEQARQMLRRALKSAEAAGNYYKINDMVNTLAKERGLSGSISGGLEALGDWGKNLVLGVQAMVAEEGDAAAADGLARLARETGLTRLGSAGENGETDLGAAEDTSINSRAGGDSA